MYPAADATLKSLADPTRRAIFERLAHDGEPTVHALTSEAGVSHGRRLETSGALKLVGLLRDWRAGRDTHYRAELQGLASLID